MIIAGDIGGTKTNLALFEEKEGSFAYLHFASYPSQHYTNLSAIVTEFLSGCQHLYSPTSFQAACFAIAGPVLGGVCKATNLPWIVDAKELSQVLKIPHLFLINDLEANAYAIEILSADQLLELYPGKGERIGNRAVISPGTGLGEAGLYWDGTSHHPFACEGGHVEFGPRNSLQFDLCRYLLDTFGHSSYERLLSGPGLHNIYRFLKERMKRPEPAWLKEELAQDDPSKVITHHALNHKSEICNEALDLFVSILGSEASNCALKFMAKGGVYLGGGIPPKILPKIQDPIFYQGFMDKGRLGELLEAIPIRVILDDKASLKGAAHFCRRHRLALSSK